MSGGPGGATEDGEDNMRDVPTPPPAAQTQSKARQAKEQEEEEVRVIDIVYVGTTCSTFSSCNLCW